MAQRHSRQKSLDAQNQQRNPLRVQRHMSESTHMPRARFLWGLALAAVTFFGFRTISNSDFWIHLATGRILVEQGWIRADPFSFTTDSSRVWVNPTWLYDALLFQLWRIGGPYCVTLAFIACVIGAFALTRPLLRTLASDANQAMALLIIAWLIAPALSVGPYGVGLLLTAAFTRALAAASLKRMLICLLPLQAAWTNIHGSFLLGPLLAGVWVVDRRSDPLKRLPTWLPLALLAATLVNPYGFRLHHLAVSSVFNPDAGALLEWVSPFHAEFAPFATRYAQMAMLIVVAAGFICVTGRLPIALASLGVTGAFLLVLSPRYHVFAGLFLFPFASISLRGLSEWITRRIGAPVWEPAGRSLAAGAAAVTLLLVSSGYYFNRIGSASTFGLGIARDVFPEHACESILARPDFPARAINLAQNGGYLAWALPQRKIFTDMRTPVYGMLFYNALARALLSDHAQLTRLVDHFNAGAFILPCSWPAAGQATRRLVDTGDWAPAYFDGVTIVLLRRTRENARLLSDFEIQRAGLLDLEHARRAYQREIDSIFPARNHPRLIGAGGIYFGLSRFPEARAVLELVTAGSPTHVTARQQLGLTYLKLAQPEKAARALERVIRYRSKDAMAHLFLGKAYELLGDTARAERLKNRGRRLNPRLAEKFEKETTALQFSN
jgi:tetratricopeptide (TPR) repeat protein